MSTKFPPIHLSHEAIDDAIEATRAAGDIEICGFFVPQNTKGQYHFVQCKNQALSPQTHFEISADEFAPYRDRQDIIIVHSHPNGPNYPSYADLSSAKSLGLVCALIAPRSIHLDGALQEERYEIILYGRPCLHSLTHRTYRHGVTDCYSYVRDMLATHYDIVMSDVAREWGWWDEGQDYYNDHLRDYDFEIIEDEDSLKKGDVFIARLRSSVDNHSGIYCGQGLIKHHLAGRYPVDRERLISIEPVSRMSPFVRLWLRHKSLQNTPEG